MLRSKIKVLIRLILKKKTLNQIRKRSFSLSAAKMIKYEDYISMATTNLFPKKLNYQNGVLTSFVNDIKQVIRPISEIEKRLLKKSNLLFNPHEVFCLKVLDQWGHTHFSKIKHGKKSSFGDESLIFREIQFMQRKLRLNNIQIQNLEILHTHPSIDMTVTTNVKTSLIQNALSETDINLCKKMSREWPFNINVKAILPNEISYSLY